MDKRLAIHCLGAFSVTLADVELSGFESDKARALLAYLATESDRPHHRERLAGLLWPDFDDKSARTNLRRVLSNVRQVIGDRTSDKPALIVAGQTVQLNAAHVWVDIQVFQEKIASENLAQLEEAVDLYNDHFLGTLAIKDSDLFEEWLTLTRSQLQQQMMHTLQRLIEAYERQGDWEKAAAMARQQLTLEPWHEPAHRQLMRLLAANGHRAEALKQYEACRSQLAQELGVTPEPATIALYEQIRDGKLDTGTTVDHVRAQPGNLPTPVRLLIGRQRELAELSQLLLDKKRRLLTILGVGGIGKTRLAIALGAAVRHHYQHGVFLVNLADHQHVEAIVPAIAEALHFTFYEGQSPRQQLADYLRQKTTLLILDNFEHLLSISPLLIELLQAAPRLQIITTSRERLALQGEQLYALAGLDVTTADGEAVQLFVQSAQLVQPDFALMPQNQTAVHQICRLLEGMPLALLLAASWIAMLSPEEIVAELNKTTGDGLGLDLLQTELRDVPTRQRSLRAVFDYSWHLLPSAEQTVCAQLALFRGGFTHEAAQAITGTSLPMLMGLVHRSFLSRSANDRFSMHELLRQFVAEQLAQAPDLQAATAAHHARHYTNFVQLQMSELTGPEQDAALSQLETENENIYLAWQWAIQHQAADYLAQILPGITFFFLWRHRYEEGAQWMEQARNQVVEDSELLAALTAVQARFQAQQQMHESAQALAQTAVAHMPGNPFTHLQLGHIWLWHSTPDNSQRHFRQALAGYRATGDSWGEAQALAGLAETANMQGSYDVAQSQFEAGLRLFEKCEDQRGRAWVLERLSYVLRDQGQLELAEQHVMTAVALYRAIGDQEKIADGALALSWLLIYMGRSEEAYAAAEKGAAILGQAGRPLPLSLLGIINLDLGLYAEAQSLLQRHVALCRESRDKVELAQGLNVLAALNIANNRYNEAQSLLSESMALMQELGQQDRLAQAQVFWGYAARGLGNIEEAWRYFQLALQTAVKIHAIVPLLFVLPGLALLLADRGEIDKATAVYGPLQAVPLLANSRLHYDMTGKELAARVKAVPPVESDLWLLAETLLAESA